MTKKRITRKLRTILRIFFSLTGCVSISVGQALYGAEAAGPRKEPKPTAPTPLEREMMRFDTNKDGKLDEAEKQAFLNYRANWRTEHIKKWDKNGNGVLDPVEQAEAKAAWRKAYKEKKAAEAAAKIKP